MSVNAQGQNLYPRTTGTPHLARVAAGPNPLRSALAILIAVAVFLATGLVLFSSTGHDDSHITYWAAKTLSDQGQILNYSYERVEQSSSLLQVLLLALAHKISSVDIVTLGGMMSIIFAVAGIVVVYYLAWMVEPRAALPAALMAATSTSCIYWAFSGMETSLTMFSALWLVCTWATYMKRPTAGGWTLLAPVLATILLVLARPEMPIVLACTLFLGGGLICLRWRFSARSEDAALNRTHARRLVVLAGICGAVCAAVILFRYLYFGDIFPQPVAAKSTGLSLDKIKGGLSYLRREVLGSAEGPVLVYFAVLALVYLTQRLIRNKSHNTYVLLSLAFLASYTAFVVCSGGDWMGIGRFVVHMLGLVFLLVSVLLARICKGRTCLYVLVGLIASLQVLSTLRCASYLSSGMPIWAEVPHEDVLMEKFEGAKLSWFERRNRPHARDIPLVYHMNQIVGRILRHKPGKVRIMSGQMGMIMYYTAARYPGRLAVMDKFGLTDRLFTDCGATADLPRGMTGLVLSYGEYFRREAEILRLSGAKGPDIIFDIGESAVQTITANGFTIVYHQRGDVWSTSTALRGVLIRGGQFIAVRNALLPAVADLRRIEMNFETFEQADLQPPPPHRPSAASP